MEHYWFDCLLALALSPRRGCDIICLSNGTEELMGVNLTQRVMNVSACTAVTLLRCRATVNSLCALHSTVVSDERLKGLNTAVTN